MTITKLQGLIQQQNRILEKIESLDNQSYELGNQILKEAETLTWQEVVQEYDKMGDSNAKFQLFLRIKDYYENKNKNKNKED
jgi:uncharacterized protein YfbU (UPF0304 family)